MRKIYSKKEPLMLLHIVNSKRDITDERQDLSPPNQYLQVACEKMNTGEKNEHHRHNVYSKITSISQESIVIIKGEILVTFYDIDNKLLEQVSLKSGDCFITYLGGHGIKCIKDDTLVYQFKTGPYFGKSKDRTLIKGAEIDD